jgi:hypothetical protein
VVKQSSDAKKKRRETERGFARKATVRIEDQAKAMTADLLIKRFAASAVLTAMIARVVALGILSARAGEMSCVAADPRQLMACVKSGRIDVPRVELAARLAAAGFAGTDAYREMRGNAARELSGRPDGAGAVTADELRVADAAIARQIKIDRGAVPRPSFPEVAHEPGRPQIEGLAIIYLNPLGDPAHANAWKNIIVHQTEGPAGSARGGAAEQFAHPTRRGVTLWVETDGTVYWATAENVIPTHGDGADRNDNKYIDNAATYHAVVRTNSIGVEFAGNYPDVTKPVTPQQIDACLKLVRFLQERYGIPSDHIYAHNWIDFKDKRYCEGCALATLAREQGYSPSR